MGKKECQVCGGPIADGRCKLCGMPYRNDEMKYHLNENRRDHYEHVSLKTRILMQEDEVPLGDKQTPPPKPDKPRPKKKKSYGSGMWKGYARHSTVNKKGEKREGQGAPAAKAEEEAARKKVMAILGLVVLLVLLSSLPEILEALVDMLGL